MRNGALAGILAVLGLLSPLPLSAHHHVEDSQLAPYAVADKVDLTRLLAPPPAVDSDETKREIAEMLQIQDSRTEAEAAAAVADHVYDVFRFSDVLGPEFNQGKLPLTGALFERVLDTGKAVVEPAKYFWDRPRPAAVDSRVEPLSKEPKSPSYPSDHATAGTLMAIVLANMVPEKADALYARGWEFARNRVVAGAHFPSDVQAGRIAGTLVAAQLFQDPEFMSDFKAARAELRAALGLPL